MNWIDIAWTMMASASLTLALFHLVVWHRQRSEYAYLVFCVLAVSVAGLAMFELLIVRAQTPAENPRRAPSRAAVRRPHAARTRQDIHIEPL